MQYFKHSNGPHPKFKKLSERVNYLKETNEGVNEMCDIVEEYAQEKVNKQAKEMAIALIKDKIYPLSKIAELTKLSIEEINQLQNDHLQNA